MNKPANRRISALMQYAAGRRSCRAKAQIWPRWADVPMNARQALVLNRVLDGMKSANNLAKNFAIHQKIILFQ
ncbi:hypothetical protein [Acidovorax sacchari]|uniref:hypothetical protein n=1 Tax=Acidovorax sacchari TaxID=3230736 RepID=UPI0039E37617